MENTQKYELVRVIEGKSSKTDKPYYIAYLLFSTPYQTQLIRSMLTKEKYDKLKNQVPRLLDVSDKVKVEYVYDKYQPVINV